MIKSYRAPDATAKSVTATLVRDASIIEEHYEEMTKLLDRLPG